MSDNKNYRLTETEVNIICQALSGLSERYANAKAEPDVATHIGLVAIDDITAKLLNNRSADVTIRSVLTSTKRQPTTANKLHGNVVGDGV